MPVIVYTAKLCPWCTKLKEWLKAHNIEFDERDVEKDPEAAQEMFDKTGQLGVPVTDVNGKIIIGFDVAELKKALRIE